MSGDTDLTRLIADELRLFLAPLIKGTRDLSAFERLLATLGWDLRRILKETGVAEADLQDKLKDLHDVVGTLVSELDQKDEYSIEELIDYWARIQALASTGKKLAEDLLNNKPSYKALDSLWVDLRDYLIRLYLEQRLTRGLSLARLLRILDEEDFTTPESFEELLEREKEAEESDPPGAPARPKQRARLPFRRTRLRPDQLKRFLERPLKHLASLLEPADPSAPTPSPEDIRKTFWARLRELSTAWGVPMSEPPPKDAEPTLGVGGDKLAEEMRTLVVQSTAEAAFGASFVLEEKDGSGNRPLVLVPFGERFADTDDGNDELIQHGQLLLRKYKTGGLEAFRIAGGSGRGLISGTEKDTFIAGLNAVLVPPSDDAPLVLFGTPGKSCLRWTGMRVDGFLDAVSGSVSLGLRIRLLDVKLEIAGFIEIDIGEVTLDISDRFTVAVSGAKLTKLDLGKIGLPGMLLKPDDMAKPVTLDLKPIPAQEGELPQLHIVKLDGLSTGFLESLLEAAAPGIGEAGVPNSDALSLRVILDFSGLGGLAEGKPVGEVIREVRVDWTKDDKSELQAPGLLKLTLAEKMTYSLVFGGEEKKGTGKVTRHLSSAALVLTCPAATQNLIEAKTAFAWASKEEREIHNDPKRKSENDGPGSSENTDEKAFLTLALHTSSKQSVALADFPGDGRPDFFVPIEPLPVDASSLTNLSRKTKPWTGWKTPDVTVADEISLPFLRALEDKIAPRCLTVVSEFQQTRDVIKSDVKLEIDLPLAITIHIGGCPDSTASDEKAALKLVTKIRLTFDVERFALDVKESGRLALTSDEQILEGDWLGLKWRFIGAKEEEKIFRFLDLQIANYDYRITQAPGCRLEIEYGALGEEPIVFIAEDFELSDAGVSLTARVSDEPARINGLDTRFRFSNSSFKIVENRIESFTLMGSGPMPPDLVGEATASIALQFEQVDGSLELVRGGAEVETDKALHCPGTGFRFELEKLGLDFVRENGYHLYFLVTGRAVYSPAGDDGDGPLSLLAGTEIQLVDCPLTGDASVIANHVSFLIPLPSPIEFDFLGCFSMEIRAIGLLPNARVFGGDPAMQIAGQVSFGDGGDQKDPRPDYHRLFIGLPAPGEVLPRVRFEGELPLRLDFGEAFNLQAGVEQVDTADLQGFRGGGTLEVKGLPPMAGSFAFMRVRRDADGRWLRAWFIYVEGRKISYPIPSVPLFLRQVGLGFGYRYTLTSIKVADETEDLARLIAELRALSRTQAALTNQEAWRPDLEPPGDDLRWTLVLSGLFAQASAAKTALEWDGTKEKEQPCAYLFDAVVALRSDLTFLMAVRTWLNTNYAQWLDSSDIQSRPLFTGFVLLSPRRRRLLAQLSSNPNGHTGSNPELPAPVKKAITNVQFSATLLLEPGLVHYELGWPNQLRWQDSIADDKLKVEVRGGMVLRSSDQRLVFGQSIVARGTLALEARADAGIAGAAISATADVAYGARQIGIVPYRAGGIVAYYAAIGVEARVDFSVHAWVSFKIKVLGKRIHIRKDLRFSQTIDFTAGLELGGHGKAGDSDLDIGMRGFGRVAIKSLGHRVELKVELDANGNAVQTAFEHTHEVLSLGLEAKEVGDVPGIARNVRDSGEGSAGAAFAGAVPPLSPPLLQGEAEGGGGGGQAATLSLAMPGYILYALRGEPGVWYFLVLPAGDEGGEEQRQGFLPVPPAESHDGWDFELVFPNTGLLPELWNLGGVTHDTTLPEDGRTLRWKANWNHSLPQDGWDGSGEGAEQAIQQVDGLDGEIPEEIAKGLIPLRHLLANAFLADGNEKLAGDPLPLAAPEPETRSDRRLDAPGDDSYEAAVRQVIRQFRGSPLFRLDEDLEYDRLLRQAFRDPGAEGDTTPANGSQNPEDNPNLAVREVRGMLIKDMISDLGDAVELKRGGAEDTDPRLKRLVERSVAFQMGLIFRIEANESKVPGWLRSSDAASGDRLKIRSRVGGKAQLDGLTASPLRLFNPKETSFEENPPEFADVRHFSSANTIAIAWRLRWAPTSGSDAARPLVKDETAAQNDPEQHLKHYLVRRRSLGTVETDQVYTLSPVEIPVDIPKEDSSGGRTASAKGFLIPRFKLVDHFNRETLEEQAALPPSGRSYLYSIIPVSFAGERGRPLTLRVTRYPDEPSVVPTDGELEIGYQLTKNDLTEQKLWTTETGAPTSIVPQEIRVTWTEPEPSSELPPVPISSYSLVFRRGRALPIGSYGLDAASDDGHASFLPTSNAERRADDLLVLLSPEGPAERRSATVNLSDLKRSGVFPGGDPPRWRPESWRVYLQTQGVNGVESALAPVRLLLDFAFPSEEPSAAVEQRQVPEIEWIPRATLLPLLPAQDARVRAADAHVPMPIPGVEDETGARDPERGSILGIEFRAHPDRLRFARFHWNQAPSRQSDYPHQLHAGFKVYRLDTDAHTLRTMTDENALQRAVRLVGEVSMVPAADLKLTPDHTRSTSGWEAWYPSQVQRMRLAEPRPETCELGAPAPPPPWYSWRDSVLIWPKLDAGDLAIELEAEDHSATGLHPMLRRILRELQGSYAVQWQDYPPQRVVDSKEAGQRGRGKRSDADELRFPDKGIEIVEQSSIESRIASLMLDTQADSDPYGWGVLQRLGLSMLLILRDRQTNEVLKPNLTALSTMLEQINEEADFPFTTGHLHLELLCQPGKALRAEKGQVTADDLLWMVQISLRPVADQTHRYHALSLEIPSGTGFRIHVDDLTRAFAPQLLCVRRPRRSANDKETTTHSIKEIDNNTKSLVFPAASGPVSTTGGNTPEQVTLVMRVKTRDNFRIRKAMERLELQLDGSDKKIKLVPPDFPSRRIGFEPKDGGSSADLGLISNFADISFEERPQAEDEGWQTFLSYFESTDSNAPLKPDKALYQDYRDWAMRFFDQGPEMDDGEPLKEGISLVSAYPRAGSPSLAAPDALGRLQWDQLIPDQWAHNYRYYIQPVGRYDRLWQALRASPLRSPERQQARSLPLVGLDAREGGGIDLALERRHPIAAPLVLSSRRLDLGSPIPAPGKAQPETRGTRPPGDTWEVILARHPEQTLSERNRTLERRLAFRQVIFSLDRSLPENTDKWTRACAAALKGPLGRQVQRLMPRTRLPEDKIPSPTLEESPADGQDPLLGLPGRLGRFSQQAMVLHWDSLPYYYEHRLHLAAQTVTGISPVTQITQRDYGYLAPKPEVMEIPQADAEAMAKAAGTDVTTKPRARWIRIRLERYWDCLTEGAKRRWPIEAPPLEPPPDGTDPVQMPISAFPDPEVVYQLFHRFNGNIEVQLELRLPIPKDPRHVEKVIFDDTNLTGLYGIAEQVLVAVGARQAILLQLEVAKDEGDPAAGRRLLLRTRRGSAKPSAETSIVTPGTDR